MSWLLVHVSACIWYLMACAHYSQVFEEMSYCIAPSWIYSGANTTWWSVSSYGGTGNRNIYAGIFDHGEGSTEYFRRNNMTDLVRLNATVGDRYFYSLYWAVTTMTTAGYVTRSINFLTCCLPASMMGASSVGWGTFMLFYNQKCYSASSPSSAGCLCFLDWYKGALLRS